MTDKDQLVESVREAYRRYQNNLRERPYTKHDKRRKDWKSWYAKDAKLYAELKGHINKALVAGIDSIPLEYPD